MITSDRRVGAVQNVAQIQLETLERLGCGCIVAIQTVRPSGVPVVSLEAKGPHCTHATHRANKVIRLGEPFDPLDYDVRDDLSI
jgi:hypothetical protein